MIYLLMYFVHLVGAIFRVALIILKYLILLKCELVEIFVRKW